MRVLSLKFFDEEAGKYHVYTQQLRMVQIWRKQKFVKTAKWWKIF